jgi:hypothetical protein
VARVDGSGEGSQIDLYGWKEGAFQKVDSAALSLGVTALNRIRSNYLQGELYPPALYVTGTLADGSRTIDVIAYQSEKESGDRKLVNLALDSETGISRERLIGYTELLPTDINDDYVVEIPTPVPLPNYSDPTTTGFWLIDWAQYGESGKREYVVTTYHNVQDSWYLKIPEKWRDCIIIARNDQIGGQREVVFSMWKQDDKVPQPFLSIYRLTGNNRTSAAGINGRFVLREEESVIYAAKFHETKWKPGVDETDLIERFNTIQSAWYSE